MADNREDGLSIIFDGTRIEQGDSGHLEHAKASICT